MKKIIYCILIIALISSIVILPNYSFGSTDLGLGELNNYGGGGEDSVKLKEKINPIIYVIQTIGSILSVVTLIAIGIKYMLGSVEEKSQYKKTLLPYVIGCVIIFSITNLVGMIFSIAKELI